MIPEQRGIERESNGFCKAGSGNRERDSSRWEGRIKGSGKWFIDNRLFFVTRTFTVFIILRRACGSFRVSLSNIRHSHTCLISHLSNIFPWFGFSSVCLLYVILVCKGRGPRVLRGRALALGERDEVREEVGGLPCGRGIKGSSSRHGDSGLCVSLVVYFTGAVQHENPSLCVWDRHNG